MKTKLSIICAVLFAIGGYMISLTNHANVILSNAKAAHAAPVVMPVQIPKDLLLGHTNNVGPTIFRDTIRDTIPLSIQHDTVRVVKYKTKWRTKKVFVPDTIAAEPKYDTIVIKKPTLIVPATCDKDSVTFDICVYNGSH